MWNTSTPDVLVVGAGPVGLFTALALTKRGIRTQVIDRGWRAGTQSYALGLHARSLSLLEEAGLRDTVLSESRMVGDIGLYRGAERCGTLHLKSPVAVLPQHLFEDILEVRLDDLGVVVRWSHEATTIEQNADRVALTVDKFEKESMGYAVAHTEWVLAKSTRMEVPFLVGADGHRSRVRRALGTAFPEVRPSHHYAVFEFQTDFDLGNELRLVIGEHTTDVLWPLPDGYCRWSFEVPDFEVEMERQKDRLLLQTGIGEYPPLCEGVLRKLIAARAPWFTGDIGHIAWRIAVRFEQRLAPSFGQGRIWLAGDAAHLTTPVGMQSMNAGLMEGRDLADTIAGILQKGDSLSELAGYDLRRSALWEDLFGLHGGQPEPLAGCLPAFGEELTELVREAKGLMEGVPGN